MTKEKMDEAYEMLCRISYVQLYESHRVYEGEPYYEEVKALIKRLREAYLKELQDKFKEL